MFYKRKYLVIIFFYFVVFGCSDSNSRKEGEYRQVKLKSEIINLNPPYLQNGYQFDISNDTMIILNGYSHDTLFQVYNLQNNELIKKFGTVGGGPHQISSPGSFYWRKYDNHIFIADNASLNIKEFDLNKSLADDEYQPNTVNHPSDLAVVFFQALNDSTFVTRQLDQTDDLLITFSEDEVIDTIGKWFQNDDPLILGDKFQQYYYVNNKHPSKSKFVAFYFNYDVIQIVDEEKGETHFVQGPDKISYKDTKTEFLGYRWAATTEKYIYASYIGKYSNAGSVTSQNPEEIHVITWEGKHIAKFELDVPIRSSLVDEEEGIIYALADDEEGNFVKFKLPPL